jgi:hypothetical protein
VLRRNLIRRARNIRGEREIDGAHDDRPTINSNSSNPVPISVWQHPRKPPFKASLFQIGSTPPPVGTLAYLRYRQARGKLERFLL